MSEQDYQKLASYNKLLARLEVGWANFLKTRSDRLRHGDESEKVAETIIEDLFTGPLDWCKGDLDYQRKHADIVVCKNLNKYLVIETKKPGTLTLGRRSVHLALDQACRYAAEQRIPSVAISDGRFLYAADLAGGELTGRLLVDLSLPAPPPNLWWISEHGIYRPYQGDEVTLGPDIGPTFPAAPTGDHPENVLLHKKYKLPASCFAYVGDPSKPDTWKLPYRLADGQIDTKRLPKAIQAILSNYRGAKVKGIPEEAMRGVLKKLAEAARSLGHLSPDGHHSEGVYKMLALSLDQLGIDWKMAG